MSVPTSRQISPATGVAIIAVTAVIGLLYVKWIPYYHRTVVAYTTHSIGHSILTGGESQIPDASIASAANYAIAYGKAIWQAMVLGLLLGAAVQEFAPRHLVREFLGRRDWRGIAAGGLLSVPGMMCTCCAAPVVVGLRRERASMSSALAFWLGNTVLNPATLLFIGFVLGWRWTALRVSFGLLMVFGVGYLVERWSPTAASTELPTDIAARSFTADTYQPCLTGWLLRFLRLARGLIPEYVVLVLLLGFARGWLFPQFGPGITDTLPWIIALAAGGLVFVSPTAGEVPIVQALLSLGIGAGPAAAVLMTLPPISLPSLAMTKSVFSYRVLAIVASTVLLVGILAGIAAAALKF